MKGGWTIKECRGELRVEGWSGGGQGTRVMEGKAEQESEGEGTKTDNEGCKEERLHNIYMYLFAE